MKNPVILIVDGNPRILGFLSKEFADAGFAVETTGNAETIMEILIRDTISLLVLDPDLPLHGIKGGIKTGAKTLMEMIESRKPATPVVVYSPYDEYAKDPAYRSAAAFVEKTGDPNELINTVKQLLMQSA